MTTSDQTSIRGGRRTSVQTVTLAVGAVFLLVGILGFVPGITSGVDQLSFAGHQSGAMLLGLFQVSILHNIVHLLFGVVGLALSRSWTGSRSYLVWGGAIYLVLWIYGLVIGHESPANFVPLNTADNWLHFVLGIAMLGLGLLLGRGHTAAKA
ncbi:DUF4383 domain-containing protein [Arthrobacter crystallopoietes]|uniref:DUF4383 domain-containing protein n=1 Tax=Crystallibacter crystallopoietes TaxID=37928 RepID=A0A1H1AH01_9MICC|nr:DUF4383 domain-containing protein [Arthrobacter crystallopoietes]AUI51532.1 hypothetical protein AC20117_12705 [Arthrobacter crystallopoietes]SDQ38964.1 protein of unknown function [Arthrobacter crystallopoietes]